MKYGAAWIALVSVLAVGVTLAPSAAAQDDPVSSAVFLATGVVACSLLGFYDDLQNLWQSSGPFPGAPLFEVVIPVILGLQGTANTLGTTAGGLYRTAAGAAISGIRTAEGVIAGLPETVHYVKCLVAHAVDEVYIAYLRWLVNGELFSRIIALQQCFMIGSGPGFWWLWPLDGSLLPTGPMPCKVV